MADKRLMGKRQIFVKSVSEDTLNDLLDVISSNSGLQCCVRFRGTGSHPSETLATGAAATEHTGKLKLCPHEDFLELCRKKAGNIYPIREKGNRTRLALIICNTEFKNLPRRTGSNHDITGMKGLLEDLGYNVQVEENLTARGMALVLRRFAACREHITSDSTFLVFMSHGILDKICGTMHSDEKPDVLPYDTIFQIFNTHNCLYLKDKPKVIIIQACRGGNSGMLYVHDLPAMSEDGSIWSLEGLTDDGVHKTHVEKDFVAFWSSTPHNVSWRSASGSLFINQLINYVQNYSWCCHLIEIFLKVQKSFEEPEFKVQMPTIERSTMTRHFYLFPGN
ncbi:caspase-13-like [Talpa occidentalis]|uniref:caspase-13-like n=1 Tax=Talpa occidentalis TaxID=50954 RepID=UPI00188EFB46|nr:caspase-13-like [Talpa occidentalis]